MVDIHAHILHGLDDGPRELAESVAMLQVAAQTGTTDIVATPHASLQFPYHPEAAAARLAQLRAAAGDSPRIHAGWDLQLHFENIRAALAHPERFSINGKGYLLVEFPEMMIARNIHEVFSQMRKAGLTPIITHPERNWLLRERLQELEAWVGQGCTVQVTAQSLLGRFGRDARAFAVALMERGLVHFIASDAHDPEDRPPRLDEAWQWVARRYGTEYAFLLFEENPKAALVGEAVRTFPAVRKRARFWPLAWWKRAR
ncbi:MAG: CpsB/CapC family capsule biosynthesis tyrosine phosphatase [Bryobacterales bacterium]|nr:hypothetical protein [Bryobacteraceae bacterium]MDW8131797.1 CpsB/CapC family capsule biosynthesis tyrosine phosphatase [Bryobacterales bacterium]